MSSKKRSRRPPPRKAAAHQPRPAADPGRSAGRSTGRAVQTSSSLLTPGGSPFRHSVERVSAPMLVLLTQMPRYLVTAAPLALLLLGAFLPLPFGFIALGIFFLLTLWLAYLSWPGVKPGHRAIRVGILALVIAIVVFRVVRK